MTDNESKRQVLKLNKTMMAELEAEYRDARLEALHTIMALTYPAGIAAAVRRFLLAGRPRDEVAAWRNHTALRELLTEYHLDLAQQAPCAGARKAIRIRARRADAYLQNNAEGCVISARQETR